MGDWGKNTNQKGDVYFYQGVEGGDIVEDGGIIQMTQGFETMAYDVLLGNNDDDDGSEATVLNQWWVNEGEQPENQSRGKLQNMIAGKPLTSGTLPEFETAALEDLSNAFVTSGYAESVAVKASIPRPKRLRLDISINLISGGTVPLALRVPV